MFRRYLAAVAALALLGVVTLASPAQAITRTFTVVMTGEQEAPTPGDPNGFGWARVTVNTDNDIICYVLTARNIAPATAAHIHEAPRGVAGPVVVALAPPTNGRSAGCVRSSEADDIAAHPRRYYVNVHNNPFPAGAIRGQLA